jgi:hypothetical protein
MDDDYDYDPAAADDGADSGLRTVGDWTAYGDREGGGVYYHNAVTGESTWDPPPGFEDLAATSASGVAAASDGEGGEDRYHEGGDGVAAGGPPSPSLAMAAAAPAVDDGGGDVDVDDGGGEGGGSGEFSPRSPPGGVGGGGGDEFSHSPSALRRDGDSSPAPSADADDDGGEDDGDDVAGGDDERDDDGAADGEDVGDGWAAYRDDSGRVYYYRAETGETQWDRPGGAGDGVGGDLDGGDLDDDDGDLDGAGGGGGVGEATAAGPADGTSAYDGGDDRATADRPDGRRGTDAPEEEEEDATAFAERTILRPDAIMEADVLDAIEKLVRGLGPEVAGPRAMQSLVSGYNGDAATCGVMGSWLARLKSAGGGGAVAASSSKGDGDDGDDDGPIRDGAADAARDVVEEVVDRLAKERFTKDHGDAIIRLDKRERAFIDRMIRSDRWRRLLIDLSATNKDSKLFMVCLQSISNLGHHRDIANRINPSEFFGVFDSMLQSELTIVGKAAVDGYATEVVDAIDVTVGPMGTLISDLRRNCASTSFTYLYAMEVIGALLTESNERLTSTDDGSKSHRIRPWILKRAIRKWEHLRDELEEEMLNPPKTGTTFQRKRKIDVALTMSDLFQRKRLRIDPRSRNAPVDDYDKGNPSNGDLANALDSALIQLLSKNSLGIPIDREVLDNVLKYAYGGSTDRIGDLLIRHPTAITALLNNLYGPKQRIRQLETRMKCARLVALAVTASERAARSSPGDQVEVTESDEDVLSEIILKGSQLCEQLENMVSFTVIDKVDENTEGSVGRRLSSMCIQHPVVSQGFLIWAKEQGSGSDFVETASYPTVSPSILCLVRLICRYHPLARPAALDISLLFLGHSNREISHQKMQSIKEQCLRLMLWLSTRGLSHVVISAVQNKLEKGCPSEMDSALVRYFFMGIIEIVRPPLSLSFVRALGGLMLKGPCVDALQSKLFDASTREQIVRLVGQFEATGKRQEVREEDKLMLSKLKATYQI